MEEEQFEESRVETVFDRAFERMRPTKTGPTDEEILEYFS